MSKSKSLVGRDVCFTTEAAEFYGVQSVDIFRVFDSRLCGGRVYEFRAAIMSADGTIIPGTVKDFHREDVRIVGE
jgi:hypothetical protein